MSTAGEPPSPSCPTHRYQLWWVNFNERKWVNSRERQRLGRWTLRGSPDVLGDLWPWLWLGQWLHVGKNATMGMGGYTLELAA